jgi:hypothetical protein
MTTITLTRSENTELHVLKCNGRFVELDPRICKIEKVSAARWEGETRHGYTFEIFGGINAGGRSNEWFVKYSAVGDFYMKATSAKQALRMIENA